MKALQSVAVGVVGGREKVLQLPLATRWGLFLLSWTAITLSTDMLLAGLLLPR